MITFTGAKGFREVMLGRESLVALSPRVKDGKSFAGASEGRIGVLFGEGGAFDGLVDGSSFDFMSESLALSGVVSSTVTALEVLSSAGC